MGRNSKQQSLETRQLIMDIATDVFAEKGVSYTSLNDIARAAGVTRGAIYWHFKNKLDLFEKMLEESKAALIDKIEKLQANNANNANNPLDLFEALLNYVFSSLIEDPKRRKIVDILFHKCEFSGEVASFRETLRAMYYLDNAKLKIILQNCINHKQLPAELNIDKAIFTLQAYISGTMRHWLLVPEFFDLAQEYPHIVRHLLNMLKFSPYLLKD